MVGSLPPDFGSIRPAMPVSMPVARPSYEPSASPLSCNSVTRNADAPRASAAATLSDQLVSVVSSMPISWLSRLTVAGSAFGNACSAAA